MPKEKSEIKVGDYVHVLIVGFNRKEDYEPPYRIESIDGDELATSSCCVRYHR